MRHETTLDRVQFLLLADYQAYVDCQEQVSAAYRDKERWVRMLILNVGVRESFHPTDSYGSIAIISGRSSR